MELEVLRATLKLSITKAKSRWKTTMKFSSVGCKAVKYDPRDLSRVYLAEPNGTYFEVPYRNLRHPHVALRELQHGAKLLRQQGKSTVDEEQLFRVVREQRALVQSAKSKTQKARRKANQHSPQSRAQAHAPVFSPGSTEDTEGVVDPFPFEIWK